MIMKKSGVTTLNGLHTVVLFPVDANYAFKHCATNLAVNKVLTYDLMRQLKRPGAVCSNDAKSCYDLIGHTVASLAMQRMGVPKGVADCLFTTLQSGIHEVRTGYGDLECSYGGEYWMIGIGQGNGAGPAIWAVVSTPLLNILWEHGFGLSYKLPISGLTLCFEGFAFINDTDLIQMLEMHNTADEVHQKLQGEATLAATSGAIVPERTDWYLIDFHLTAGNWRYKTIQETPGDLFVEDISGERKLLSRVEVHESRETLGIIISPDGNMNGQFEKLHKLAKEWVKMMQESNLSGSDMWTALQSTIWRTMAYSLPAKTMSKLQWEIIMSTLLTFALSAMGICRHFPRDIVFAPGKYFGLGIKHLYTLQETTRLKDIIYLTHNQTNTGILYLTSMELLHIELGFTAPLHTNPSLPSPC
jgi:hypothetical protein